MLFPIASLSQQTQKHEQAPGTEETPGKSLNRAREELSPATDSQTWLESSNESSLSILTPKPSHHTFNLTE